ncbi:MAG: hypothetical protein HUJ25_12445 [Crocinitomicaceae bacterium]|nr:hypothetical protein [Crocinitomicaceae bacterium]
MNKVLIVIGIGGLAFLGGRYLWQLNRAGEKAAVEVSGRVHKITLNGVEVVLSYNIKNPTNVAIEMAVPLVKLSHRQKVIASSSMSLVNIPEDAKTANGRIRIAPNAETGYIQTSILLPYLSLIGAGSSVITALKNRLNSTGDEEQEPVEFEVQTTSTVFTKLGSVPFDDVQTIRF